MNRLPILDTVGTPLFAGLFALLLFLQWKFPLRRQHFSMLRRLLRNFVFSFPAFVLMRLTLIPIPLSLAYWAERHHVGLLHWLPLPQVLSAIAGFLILDWSYYWWHYATHAVPFFWRFHNVHHTDLDLDLSTAARFHFGEIIVSIPFRILVVLLFGPAPMTYLLFEVVFESASLFHHSNWRLPIRVERLLNHVIVTPRMHGIHHSIVKRETDSNWGTIFCWWDKLHRSLRRDIPQDALEIGVASYREENELTIGKLLLLPFREQREWKLPSGAIPERRECDAKELEA